MLLHVQERLLVQWIRYKVPAVSRVASLFKGHLFWTSSNCWYGPGKRSVSLKHLCLEELHPLLVGAAEHTEHFPPIVFPGDVTVCRGCRRGYDLVGEVDANGNKKESYGFP